MDQYEREIGTEVEANDWAERTKFNLTPQYSVVRDFDCHVDNWERLEKEVKRLWKKAQKLGYTPPLLLCYSRDHVVTVLEDERDDEGIVRTLTRKYRVRRCVVAGEELKLNGYEIVAAVDWLDGQPVVRAFPGKQVSTHEGAWLHSVGPRCTHCNTTRSRNTTYILHGEDDLPLSFHQVGSTCLKDFCGIDPGYAAEVAALYRAGGVEPGSRYEEDLNDELAWWCLAVRITGRFVSRAMVERELDNGGKRMMTTVQDAHVLRQERYNNPQAPQPEEVDLALAQKVKAYVATLDPEQSQYNGNLRAVYDSGILLPRHAGLAASAVGAYLREEARVAEAQARAAATRPSKHLGEVGERVVVKVKVTSCYETEGAYGTTWIYRLVTPEGDKATWFSSREALEVGQETILVGTVKKLENYKGEDQTVLTRCREV